MEALKAVVKIAPQLAAIAAIAPDMVEIVEEKKRYGWLWKGAKTVGGYFAGIIGFLAIAWTFARDAIKSIGHTP